MPDMTSLDASEVLSACLLHQFRSHLNRGMSPAVNYLQTTLFDAISKRHAAH